MAGPAVAAHASYAADDTPSTLALAALAALGQPSRLTIFKLLMRAEPDGMAAGDVARRIGVPQNTLSSHLAVLARSGLVSGRRNGRSIVYRANVERMRGLIEFLIDDCCDRHPELCGFAASAARDNRRPRSKCEART